MNRKSWLDLQLSNSSAMYLQSEGKKSAKSIFDSS